jgi:hypothetical protein
LIQFNKVNSEESVKQLRAHVVNTIKKASNYNGSAIQRQLGDKVVAKAEVPVAEKPKPAATKIPAKVAAKVEPAPEPEDNDADVPF